MGKIQEVQRILQELRLLPGKHNELQIAVIQSFCPRFTPDATILYLCDATNKFVIYEKEELEKLGVPITMHEKLPYIILYDGARKLLFLIEVVTSRRPVSHRRLFELERMLKNCIPKRVYISAFLDFAEYGRHELQIAWETEVWIAEIPEHMIHYNGDRYMGQHG